jgi:hypothetical protein
MKLVSCGSVSSLLFFRVSVRPFEGALQEPNACCDTETRSDQRQPVPRVELLVQPPTPEEADEYARREV